MVTVVALAFPTCALWGSASVYLDKCLSHVDRIACVTVSYYPVTWAATRRLRRIYLYFWTADAVYASSLTWLHEDMQCPRK